MRLYESVRKLYAPPSLVRLILDMRDILSTRADVELGRQFILRYTVCAMRASLIRDETREAHQRHQ